jgi:alanine racemase
MTVTRALVDLSAIDGNIRYVRNGLDGDTSIIAVVKANAYGHGLLPVARRALQSGAAMLAVATDVEGAQLRESGIGAPILVMGGLLPQSAAAIVKHRLIATVFTPEMVYALSMAAGPGDRTVPVHLKVESGMNRIGARPGRELAAVLDALSVCPRVRPVGVFSHLATAEQDDDSFTREQTERFLEGVEQVRAAGYSPKVHIANSAAAMMREYTHMDGVRLGIAMYGLDPAGKPNPFLRPALKWVTRVVYVKGIEAGDTVSYGRIYTAPGPRTIATLPVGYADGYRRSFGGAAHVLIAGRRAPVIGRVCMDQCMVDVTGIPGVKIGDEVVLMGRQDGEAVTAEELADIAGTINYEIVTGIGERVPRVHHD